MRSRLAVALFASFCAAPVAAEVHEPIAMSQATPLVRAAAETHRVAVRVVILSGSRWTLDAVNIRVAKTRDIIAQCGVRLDATIVELTAPGGGAGVLYASERSQEPTGMSTITGFLAQPKPTIYYVGAFTDNTGQSGTSRPRHTVSGAPIPEMDTAWIPYSEVPPYWHANYHVDAHELVHVLANIAHWSPPYRSPPGHMKGDADPNRPDPGLMVQNNYIRSNIIDTYLCERIKNHPSAAPL